MFSAAIPSPAKDPLLLESAPRRNGVYRGILNFLLSFLAGLLFAICATKFSLLRNCGLSCDCKPLEVHLGVTDDPTTMRVTWRTVGDRCPSIVHYSLLHTPQFNGKYSMEATGMSYVADSDMLCGDHASEFSFVDYFHTVVLTGLEVNSEYKYFIPGDGDREFSFTSSKAPGDGSEFDVYIFGDMGLDVGKKAEKYAGASRVMNAMEKEIQKRRPDLMLDVGDISYANGNPYIWNAFMSAIERFASRGLWVAGVGNHEYDLNANQKKDPWGIKPFQPVWGNMDEGDSRGECGLHAYWRFPVGELFSPVKANHAKSHLPVPSHGDQFPPFYYSFNQGTVHVIFISTEHDVEENSPQMAWLEKDLAAVDRCKTPFVIVNGHRPFYSPISDQKDYQTGLGLQARVEPMLIKYRVDLFVSGHVHGYYRLCEAKDGVCVEPGEGLVSMVIGSGGHKLDHMQEVDFPFDDFSLHLKWGFGKFSVKGHDYIDFSFIEAEEGEVLDQHIFQNQNLCSA